MVKPVVKPPFPKARPRDTRSKPFGAPYGNSSSYTPASDYSPSYTPPDYSAPDPAPASDYSGGGGSFDGGGSSGDW